MLLLLPTCHCLLPQPGQVSVHKTRSSPLVQPCWEPGGKHPVGSSGPVFGSSPLVLLTLDTGLPQEAIPTGKQCV